MRVRTGAAQASHGVETEEGETRTVLTQERARPERFELADEEASGSAAAKQASSAKPGSSLRPSPSSRL